MFRFGLIIALLVIVADQVSKWYIVTKVMDPPQVITVTWFFNLVLAWNKGISFSFFSNGTAYTTWLLLAAAALIVIFLLFWLRKAESRVLALGIGLVVGGAIGNVIDRLRFGAVIDFLEFHIADYYWPAFNVADSAITIGVAFILIDSLWYKAKSTN